MKSLREIIIEAEKQGVAVGHFNISDLTALKAIFEAARELSVPVIIGTSDGEANFIGRHQAAALIRSLREQHQYPIFLNSDHTHKMEGVREAALAQYDAIIFDGGKLDLARNIKQTKEAMEYVKSVNPEILVEGELGYIGSSSKILKELPEGAAINPEDLTRPEEAARFVQETGVDLLAPAVGNLHGIVIAQTDADRTQTNTNSGGQYANPRLDIERIRKIKEAAKVPLVLHGGSGIRDEDFRAAIQAGISIIHINTEIRAAWRKGIKKGLEEGSEEVTPYKILPAAVEEIKKVVLERLKLFNRLG